MNRGSLAIVCLSILFSACNPPPISSPPQTTTSPNPIAQNSHVSVYFKDGTTYQQAQDFLHKVGFKIEGINPVWKESGFKANNSTPLQSSDFFNIPASRCNQFDSYKLAKQIETSEIVLKAIPEGGYACVD